MVCIFYAEVIHARNNSGYIRSFIAYKAQKLLIIREFDVRKVLKKL